jgi:hypothetical protein
MQVNWRRKVVILVPAICLVVVLAADLAQWFRPSIVAAVACTPKLVAGSPDPQAIVRAYHDDIVAQAALHDLPPELVAAVIINHQRYLSSFRRFTDCAGSALGANLSLGLAQLRLSTAAQGDGRMLDDLSATEFRALRTRLLDPRQNIAYEARELRSLLERKSRYPGMSAAELIHDPFVMALAVTEYRMGRLTTASRSSRLSAEAFNALNVIQKETLGLFGRYADDARRVRTEIGEYLDFIYCESGIFNAGVCADWRD